MAGILEEYDEATPMKRMYCSRLLTDEEYEQETVDYTQKCLHELLGHLNENPEEYSKVMVKRKKEEAESSGLLSYMKVTLRY